MNKLVQFKMIYDTDGSLDSQMNNLINQDGINIITINPVTDHTQNKSGLLVCYIIVGGNSNQDTQATTK